METQASGSIVGQVILIVFLTLINAFFASAEMAIVSINKNKVKMMAEEGNKKAILLLNLINEPSRFLATIQVGITLAGFFSSASAATGISVRFSSYLDSLSVPYSRQIAVVLITIALSYITLVFGELFPKRIALQKSEAIAMFSIKPVHFVSKVMKPFVRFLSASTNVLVKLFGFNYDKLEEQVSKEEIKMLVEVGQENGVFNETEKDMINSIFEFDDIIAQEVMTPRTEAYILNIKTPPQEFLDELLHEKYSRVPVYEGDSDNIIGILFLKDLFIEAREHGFEHIDIRKILHAPYFVPETKNIDDLFKELQASKNHMAILIDEYGGFSGIVTIEDLIEEVMGNIDDEYDDNEPEIVKVDENTYLVSGLLSINELNDYLDIELDSEHSDTIGGLLVDLLGTIPQSGEEQVIEHENIVFKIEEVKEKRIEKIKICLLKDK
ncbi:MAG: HlyC/CorC family transporter [Vallitaleaceae bacterium]|nr:HlyC/CorC family transporter [Vallitaleaceae bacterium]